MDYSLLKKIRFSETIRLKVPQLALGTILCKVRILAKDERLWEEIEKTGEHWKETLSISEIKNISAIDAARKAYKACGKDPARYRLSAEALIRRVLKGNDLYQLNNVVDFVNYVSLRTGFSIGGYDADKLKGDIIFDVGKSSELYQGIGRGILNINGLPVFRDDEGAFGSPTSDSVRTSVNKDTQNFLMILIGFSGADETLGAMNLACALLEKYDWASEVNNLLIK